MKHLLLIAAFSLSALASTAQLKLTEQFDNTIFTASGNLGTKNSWVQNGGGTDVQVVFKTNNTGALTYPSYSSGRTYVTIGTNGTDPHKLFTGATIPLGTTGTFFTTFVVRVTSATTAGDYILALGTDAGDFVGRFYVRTNSGNLQFGISGNGTGISWTGTHSFNTTYLIAIRYDIVTGSTTNDDMYMWVNPSTVTEPATGSATLTRLNVSETYDGSGGSVDDMNKIALRQSGNSPIAALDAIRVAYGSGQSTQAANASAAWANLGAAGAPLPVNFANVKAYSKGTGVQLEWSNMTETDVLNYVVERSSNGVDFTTVANVMAKQNDGGKADYSFYDANPAAVNYYRIQSLEGNNSKKYSVIVKVDTKAAQTDVVLYPNPVTGSTLSLQATGLEKGQYMLRVMSANGQQVYAKSLAHAGGAVTSSVELPSTIKPGMYTLQIAGAITVINKSFIVR